MTKPRRTRPDDPAGMATRIAIKVVPRAASNEVIGWMGDALKVRIAAAPEQGRANAALESLLASMLGVSRRDVRVVSGHGSPRKVVEIRGIDADALEGRLPVKRS